MPLLEALRSRVHAFNARRELDRCAPRLARESAGASADELVDLLFSARWQRFFWIRQIRSEIVQLARLVERRRPRTLLEIGTAGGGSFFLLAKLAHPEATLVSIDLPGGEFGGGYPAYKATFYRSFAQPRQTVHLLRMSSARPDAPDRIRSLLGGRGLDFLFVDGDHTYDGVKSDFTRYAPLVNDDGLIALHDVAEHADTRVGVKRFWDELKSSHTYDEFITEPPQGWAGIGVIYGSRSSDATLPTPNR